MIFKYRAKRKDNGEYVTGSLIWSPNRKTYNAIIIDENATLYSQVPAVGGNPLVIIPSDWHNVDADTLEVVE